MQLRSCRCSGQCERHSPASSVCSRSPIFLPALLERIPMSPGTDCQMWLTRCLCLCPNYHPAAEQNHPDNQDSMRRFLFLIASVWHLAAANPQKLVLTAHEKTVFEGPLEDLELRRHFHYKCASVTVVVRGSPPRFRCKHAKNMVLMVSDTL